MTHDHNDPERNRGMEALRGPDPRDVEIARLREALQWNAATLQAACRMAEPIREAGDITIHGETRTVAAILDLADAALSQEQS